MSIVYLLNLERDHKCLIYCSVHNNRGLRQLTMAMLRTMPLEKEIFIFYLQIWQLPELWTLYYCITVSLKTCLSLICNDGIQSQKEIQNISCCCSCSSQDAEHGYFTLLFTEDSKETENNFYCMFIATVLLIKQFSSWFSKLPDTVLWEAGK